MKKNLKILLTLAFVLVISFSAAANASEKQERVWKTYLSPKEHAALTKIAAEAKHEAEGAPEAPTDPKIMVAAMREGFEKFAADSIQIPTSIVVEAFDENGVKGLWFKPKGANEKQVLLYFHGGGYVVGSSKTGAAVASGLAEQAGIVSFSLDYPLAPESLYPAALDNALEAYKMLLGKGFKNTDIVLAGDSAGGGLAVAMLLSLRDKGLPMPAGAYLLSPWTDLSNSFETHETKKKVDLAINREFLETLASLYAKGQDIKNPLISPAFGDLIGFPPLLIHVGSYETLLDDSLTLARNAALADVPVKLTVWPGYFHVFQMFPNQLEGGKKALHDGAAFFKDVMQQTLLRPAVTEK